MEVSDAQLKNVEINNIMAPYSQAVSSLNPTCFMFLIDQSGSMDDIWNDNNDKKKKVVCRIINSLIHELITKCIKGDNYKHYYDISLIGYGDNVVESAFIGNYKGDNNILVEFNGKEIWPIQDLANTELRNDKNKPYWIQPKAHGNTPMYAAFNRAYAILEEWIKKHQDSYPPLVINITDGEIFHKHTPDHEKIREIATKIKDLKTNDGNVLLFNVHIDSNKIDTIVDLKDLSYPNREMLVEKIELIKNMLYKNKLYNLNREDDPKNVPYNLYFKNLSELYEISSELTFKQQEIVESSLKQSTGDGSRRKGLIYNASPKSLISFLNIGTQQDIIIGDSLNPR